MRILSFYEAFAAAYATLLLAVILLAMSMGTELGRSAGLGVSLVLFVLALVYAIIRTSGNRPTQERLSSARARNLRADDTPRFEDPLLEKRLAEDVVDWVDDSPNKPTND